MRYPIAKEQARQGEQRIYGNGIFRLVVAISFVFKVPHAESLSLARVSRWPFKLPRLIYIILLSGLLLEDYGLVAQCLSRYIMVGTPLFSTSMDLMFERVPAELPRLVSYIPTGCPPVRM